MSKHAFLAENGVESESLDKKAVKALLNEADEDVAEVLSYRQQLAKSSVSKYRAMENMCCEDHRARGCFQFYGASRTGRWSGKGIQIQNLVQNHMEDLAEARSLVRDGNFDAIGSPPHVRGKARMISAAAEELRITPACAGKRPLL